MSGCATYQESREHAMVNYRRSYNNWMRNRRRLLFKCGLACALACATLSGLSSLFAQRSPGRSESIVVFAPHPDDEVIGCAGTIMQALERGARVKVVDITSGDGFDAAAASLTHKTVNQIGPDDFFALSRLRQTQSLNALEILGGKADDLLLLGYPDGELGDLYNSTGDKRIRQQLTQKDETYALIQKDYHTSVHGNPAPYQR